MPITGTTRLYVILADPVGQVRAPSLFNPLFAQHGVDAVFVPMHVAAGDLNQVWTGLTGMQNLDGILITVPHKVAVAGLCDRLETQGALVGAVNTVRRDADGTMVGTMFDGLGFVDGLRQHGHDPKRRRVLQIGAGGAGQAVAFALAEAGVSSLTIANRSVDKADALCRRITAAGMMARAHPAPADVDPVGFDMVVNTTSLGLQADDPLPVDVARLDPGTVVADIIMKPAQTPLLQAALARGLPVQYGAPMLDAQIRLMTDFFGLPFSD